MTPAAAWALCIALVAATTVADHATGPHFHLDLFYLVPALLAARWIGRKTGLFFALLCASLSVVVEVSWGHPFTHHPSLGLWAGAMRFGTWGAAVWLVSERQQHLERMELLVAELRGAMSEIKQLKGLLPVCAWCRKVRLKEGTWLRLEEYLQETTNASVTHSICPDCAREAEQKIGTAR